jgi:hypothetical protein
MSIFGRVVRWLCGRPVWAGNRYDPGDTGTYQYTVARLGRTTLLTLALLIHYPAGDPEPGLWHGLKRRANEY